MSEKTSKKASRSPKNPAEMKALIMDKTWRTKDFGRGARGNVGLPMVKAIWQAAQDAFVAAQGEYTPAPAPASAPSMDVIIAAAEKERDTNKPGSRIWAAKDQVVKALRAAAN